MNIKQKIPATLIHLSSSLVVFFVFIYLLRFFWYPEPYFTASGGWQGLKIVALVDIVLGPLLTFVVFNKAKPRKELFIDISLIVALQLSALLWGINTVYQQRPVAIVFWDDRFFTVPDNALSTHYANNEKYQALLKQSLPFVFARRPANNIELETMQQRIKDFNIAPHHQVENYQDFDSVFSTIKLMSMNMGAVIARNGDMRNSLKHILKKTGTTMEDNIYLPLQSKYQDIVLVFDQQGHQIGFIKAPFKVAENI
jgi:hypothetical protein